MEEFSKFQIDFMWNCFILHTFSEQKANLIYFNLFYISQKESYFSHFSIFHTRSHKEYVFHIFPYSTHRVIKSMYFSYFLYSTHGKACLFQIVPYFMLHTWSHKNFVYFTHGKIKSLCDGRNVFGIRKIITKWN